MDYTAENMAYQNYGGPSHSRSALPVDTSFADRAHFGPEISGSMPRGQVNRGRGRGQGRGNNSNREHRTNEFRVDRETGPMDYKEALEVLGYSDEPPPAPCGTHYYYPTGTAVSYGPGPGINPEYACETEPNVRFCRTLGAPRPKESAVPAGDAIIDEQGLSQVALMERELVHNEGLLAMEAIDEIRILTKEWLDDSSIVLMPKVIKILSKTDHKVTELFRVLLVKQSNLTTKQRLEYTKDLVLRDQQEERGTKRAVDGAIKSAREFNAAEINERVKIQMMKERVIRKQREADELHAIAKRVVHRRLLSKLKRDARNNGGVQEFLEITVRLSKN